MHCERERHGRCANVDRLSAAISAAAAILSATITAWNAQRNPANSAVRAGAEGYDRANLTEFVERSLASLDVETIDLLQLHCPPSQVLYMPEVFGVLDDLVSAGKLRHYGVGVEKVEEALKAIEYPGVRSVQIVYNIFRQRPAELLFRETLARRVGILARLPRSSGMLSGRLGAQDERGRHVCDPRRPTQVDENMRAADLPPLSADAMKAVADIYGRFARDRVHHRWCEAANVLTG
jgi:aryl-alcohol dehydrogenase-like predicted oxidoreductase